MIDTGIDFVIEYIGRIVTPTSCEVESTQDRLSNLVFTAGRGSEVIAAHDSALSRAARTARGGGL